MIVLDSSVLCAWHNQRDVHHERARAFMTDFLAGRWGRGLLLDYVLLEVLTVLLARRGREPAFEASRRLLQARELDLLFGAEVFSQAIETFRSQKGRDLSFVDAAIVTAARLHLAAIATFDNGFRAVDDLTIVPSPDTVQEGR